MGWVDGSAGERGPARGPDGSHEGTMSHRAHANAKTPVDRFRGRRSPRSSLARVVHQARMMGDVWVARHRNRKPRYLPIVLGFVTFRCNLSCRACGVAQQLEAHRRELTTREWQEAIDAMARLGTAIISFSGGEALLRPDIFDIIAHAGRRHIAVHLCTNATRIDARTARRLAEAGTHTVSISLDGSRPETHDAIRGKGSFEATMAGIAALRRHAPGIRIGINYLITVSNVTDMVPTLALAESLGVRQVKFAPVHTNLLHRDKPIGTYADLVFRTDRDLQRLEREVSRLIGVARRARVQVNPVSYLEGIVDLYRSPRRFRCYAGYAVCAIGPTGEVTPCCDMSGGPNLRDQPLDVIWRSDAFHALRQEVRHCRAPCWDTTNTELSLRLSARNLPRELPDTLRALKFYFGKGAR